MMKDEKVKGFIKARQKFSVSLQTNFGYQTCLLPIQRLQVAGNCNILSRREVPAMFFCLFPLTSHSSVPHKLAPLNILLYFLAYHTLETFSPLASLPNTIMDLNICYGKTTVDFFVTSLPA